MSNITSKFSMEEVCALVAAAADIMAHQRVNQLVQPIPALPVYASALHGATMELLISSGLCENHSEARQWIMKQAARIRK